MFKTRIVYEKCLREYQQDAVFSFIQPRENADFGIFGVSDGMGSREGSEAVSSNIPAILTLFLGLQPPLHSCRNAYEMRFAKFVRTMNSTIIPIVDNSRNLKTGATVSIAIIDNGQVFACNIGDSPIYLLKKSSKNAKKLYSEHTKARSLFDSGKISEEESQKHPYSTILTSFLSRNAKSVTKISFFREKIEPEDVLVLCSDGALEPFSETNELSSLFFNLSFNDACNRWRERIIQESEDNSSFVAVQYCHETLIPELQKASGKVIKE